MKPFLLFITALLSLTPTLPAQDHGHLNAGIKDANNNGIPDAGERLQFVNGADFNVASGYALNLTFKTDNRYVGTFSGNLTFTALGIDPSVGGPEFGHAAPGTHIVVQMMSLSGPAGATFSFWDSTGSVPAISLGVGEPPSSSMRWDLSENDGQPGEDPFGHIHDRQFSVDQPGTYVVTFQLFDTSTNGVGGGPIHQPSETFQMKFVAVPEPGVVALVALGVVVAIMAGRPRRQL